MAKESLQLNRDAMDRKIAVAFDGSEGSRRALQEAFLMARAGNRKLSIIFIEELPRYPGAPSETNEERERTDALFETAPQRGGWQGYEPWRSSPGGEACRPSSPRPGSVREGSRN
jgi:hypothetical protein